MKKVFFALLFSCLANCVYAQDDWNPITDINKDNFYIYIIFGQSNAEGYACTPTESDKVKNPNLKNLIAYNNYSNYECTGVDAYADIIGTWEDVSEPNCRKSKIEPTKCGWVKAFGEEMQKLNPGKKFGFVHVAVASAGIVMFDKELGTQFCDGTLPSTYKTPNTWAQKKANYAYAGNPYKRIIDMAKIAKQYGTIKGILMHQGEEDGGKSYWASEVKKIYNDMLTDLELDGKNVPLVVGEPTSYCGRIANIDNISDPTNAKYIENCHKVAALDLTFNASNKLHFDHEGYMQLGKRYAEKATELLGSASGILNPTVEDSDFKVEIKNADNGGIGISSTLPLKSITTYTSNGSLISSVSCHETKDVTMTVPATIDEPIVMVFDSIDNKKFVLKTSLSK